MKKNTKNTIKVLSGLALVSTVVVATNNTVDAKTYKPEVRYDNGKYFVKTSDPSAKGKGLNFLVSHNNQEDPYFLYHALPNYQFEEFEVPSTITNLNGEEKVTENNLVSIKDVEDTSIPNRELEDISDSEFAKKKAAYYEEATKGAVSIKEALGKKQGGSAEVNVETPQSKLEPQEGPKTSPETTLKSEPQEGPKTSPETTPKSKPQEGLKTSPETPSKSEPKEEPKATPETTPKSEPKEGSKTSPENSKTVSQQGLDTKNRKESKLDADSTIGEKVKEKQENLSSIFGQNSELNKKDVKNKSNDRVDNKKSNEILANTGLRTNSYALLTSIVGLVGAIALRREKR